MIQDNILIELLLHNYQVIVIFVFSNGLHISNCQPDSFQSQSHSKHKRQTYLNTLPKHEAKVVFKIHISKQIACNPIKETKTLILQDMMHKSQNSSNLTIETTNNLQKMVV